MRAGFMAGLLSLVSTALCAQSLYVVPDGVETRWTSPENPGGERGKGASANAGRKGSGTGTEDYIGTGYSLGAYSHLYQGAPIADHQKQRYAFYRYHVNDPVYFRREIRVTLQQIGFIWSNDGTPEKPVAPPIYAAGEGLRELDLKHLPRVNLFERADDYSSCAYFYLDRAENGLPSLATAAERIKGL
jgi:hypothetical protein